MRFRDNVNSDSISLEVLVCLNDIEERWGWDLDITSGYREGSSGDHGTGEGVDIACSTSDFRFELVRALLDWGVSRIGIYDRHIHAGFSEGLPQDVLWTGVSK